MHCRLLLGATRKRSPRVMLLSQCPVGPRALNVLHFQRERFAAANVSLIKVAPTLAVAGGVAIVRSAMAREQAAEPVARMWEAS